MEFRNFGNTGLKVSVIGFGAGHIGSSQMDENTVGRLLNNVLDLGINLIDTARSYGESERRIGRHLSRRRHEFILSTKVGYSFQNFPDWSFESTMGTINEALEQLQTDYLDIVHLHSCEKWVLEQGHAILALEKAKDEGKVRVIAYSGENDALGYSIDTNRFESIQCSVNVFDQLGIDRYLPQASGSGMGIIAKRPMANSVWRYQSRPDGHSHAEYWDRMQQLSIHIHGMDWKELALRFTAHTPFVDTVITGTSNIKHLKENIKIIAKGPLDPKEYSRIRSGFKEHQKNWNGLI